MSLSALPPTEIGLGHAARDQRGDKIRYTNWIYGRMGFSFVAWTVPPAFNFDIFEPVPVPVPSISSVNTKDTFVRVRKHVVEAERGR